MTDLSNTAQIRAASDCVGSLRKTAQALENFGKTPNIGIVGHGLTFPE